MSCKHIVLLLLVLCGFTEASDIECLQEFRKSVQDPHGHLGSWNFTELTELTERHVCKFRGVACQNLLVSALRLPSLQLRGRFPSGLDKCASLKEVDLSNNSFTGPIPNFVCHSNNKLAFSMSYNDIRGTMPAFNACANGSLDFSHNKVSGTIPAFDPSRLRMLNFSFNNLSGAIPDNMYGTLLKGNPLSFPDFQCLANFRRSIVDPHRFLDAYTEGQTDGFCKLNGVMCDNPDGDPNTRYQLQLASSDLGGTFPDLKNCTRLYSMDLSDNNFTGPVPRNICEHLPSRFSGTLDLSYNHIARPVNASCISSLNLDHNLAYVKVPLPFPTTKSRIKLWFCVLLSLLCPVVALLVLWLKRSVELQEYQEYLHFSKDEFYMLTNDFHTDMIIGTGGSSTVYLGRLASGQYVAVKRLKTRADKNSFIRELSILGKLRHRNLVRVLGCFMDQEVMALILECMLFGSLEDLLHPKEQQPSMYFKWQHRYKVALGVAQGLCYLHHDYGQPVVHCDLKPSNILLDRDFEPHIADFGISKLCHSHLEDAGSQSIMWTIGYTAPEAAQLTKVSPRADVYSFGVVLMELLTNQRPHSVEGTLPNQVKHALERGEVLEILDSQLQLETQYHKDIAEVLKIALSCTRHSPSERPEMRDILKKLESIGCTKDHYRNVTTEMMLEIEPKQIRAAKDTTTEHEQQRI